MTINGKWVGTDSYIYSLATAATNSNVQTPVLRKIVEALEDDDHESNIDVDNAALVAELESIQMATGNNVGAIAIEELT